MTKRTRKIVIGHFFYERIGHRSTASAFETRAALQAGDAVRAEVRRSMR